MRKWFTPWEFAPELLVGVGLGVFALAEPSAARSAFKSSTALALMAGGGLAWVIGRVVCARFVRWPAVRAAAFAAAGAVVLAVVVVPAYDDTTVVETLPVAEQAATTTAVAPLPVAEQPATPANPATRAFVTAPTSAVTTTTFGSRGAFRGIDHRASGTARVYGRTLGLEDIDIQPGPDYDLYVVPGAGRGDVDGGTRIDDLKGNKGTQYYELPAGVDLSVGDWSVVVWCQIFDVPVAAATLS